MLAPDDDGLGCVVGSPALAVDAHVDIDAVFGQPYLVRSPRPPTSHPWRLAVSASRSFSAEPLPTGHVTSSGDVRFDWTIACSVNGTLEPEIDLDQGTGANRAMGSELVTVNCIPPETVVHMTVRHGSGPNPNARFHAGDAKALSRSGCSRSCRPMTGHAPGHPVDRRPSTDGGAAGPNFAADLDGGDSGCGRRRRRGP